MKQKSEILNLLIKDLEKALKRLEEVLKLEKNPINRDSAILRFEFSFELTWKTIQRFAREEGIECYSPRECIKKGFILGLIKEDPAWFEMIKDRNLIVHTYEEKTADEIYQKLPNYLNLMKNLLVRLKEKI